jgi:hypothetical protein
VLNHGGKKLLASVAGPEERTAQDRLELAENRLFVRAIRWVWIAVGYDRRMHRNHDSAGTALYVADNRGLSTALAL